MRLTITGASTSVRHELWTHGVRPPQVAFLRNIEEAVAEEDAGTEAIAAG